MISGHLAKLDCVLLTPRCTQDPVGRRRRTRAAYRGTAFSCAGRSHSPFLIGEHIVYAGGPHPAASIGPGFQAWSDVALVPGTIAGNGRLAIREGRDG